MRSRGFTLIELMIVIAVIAVVAAVAIPGIVSSVRTSNERNASASLKNLFPAQMTFKTTDADRNGVSDFWSLDVNGLYDFLPSGASEPIKMIEVAVALADVNTKPSPMYTLPPTRRSSPKAGYWYQNVGGNWDVATGSFVDLGPPDAVNQFGFAAIPHSYGSSGKLIFCINQAGTMYKVDTGSQANCWATQPLIDVVDTNGDTVPPASGFSKMD
jgi:prepilin-type N-terminal cleavage/methylation domain-containing protein